VGRRRKRDRAYFADGYKIRTVEHLFGAIAGLGLDEVAVDVVGGEVPAMDGCASSFADSLSGAGLTEDGFLDPVRLDSPVAVDDRSSGRSMVALPYDGLRVTYVVDYPGTAIGTQCLSTDLSRDNFIDRIASCRTFAMMEDVETLRKNGLSLGGSLENAMVVDGRKVLAKGGLRFEDEFVRHKILDLLGDLVLLGRPLAAHVIAIKAGHAMHQRLVKEIAKRIISED
jgi:UDP-3-O-[3-hydroxymyristoyl] N-acetylglucosamine deacetylase